MTVVAIIGQRHPGPSRCFTAPHAAGVKRSQPLAVGVYARQLLPADPVGATTLSLTNLAVGSAIRIEAAGTGALVQARTAVSSTESFSLSVYTPGNPNNSLRIKVRKGSSAPFFIPWETLAAITLAPQSIYVSQIPDE